MPNLLLANMIHEAISLSLTVRCWNPSNIKFLGILELLPF